MSGCVDADQVFFDIFEVLAEAYDARDPDTHMVAPAQVALQLAEWSAPDRVVEGLSERDELVHVDMAQATLQRLFGIEGRAYLLTGDLRRALGQMLSKLYYPPMLRAERARALALLAAHVAQRSDDSVFRNAIGRFGAVLERRYADALAGWNPAAATTDGTFDTPETEPLRTLVGALPTVPRLPSTVRATRSRRTVSSSTQGTATSWDEEPDEPEEDEQDEPDDQDDQDERDEPASHPQVAMDEDELAI